MSSIVVCISILIVRKTHIKIYTGAKPFLRAYLKPFIVTETKMRAYLLAS
jgi:hypothetical protein